MSAPKFKVLIESKRSSRQYTLIWNSQFPKPLDSAKKTILERHGEDLFVRVLDSPFQGLHPLVWKKFQQTAQTSFPNHTIKVTSLNIPKAIYLVNKKKVIEVSSDTVSPFLVFSGSGHHAFYSQMIGSEYLGYSRKKPVFELKVDRQIFQVTALLPQVFVKLKGKQPLPLAPRNNMELNLKDFLSVTIFRGSRWWRFSGIENPQGLGIHSEDLLKIFQNRSLLKKEQNTFLASLLLFFLLSLTIIIMLARRVPSPVVTPSVTEETVLHFKKASPSPNRPKKEPVKHEMQVNKQQKMEKSAPKTPPAELPKPAPQKPKTEAAPKKTPKLPTPVPLTPKKLAAPAPILSKPTPPKPIVPKVVAPPKHVIPKQTPLLPAANAPKKAPPPPALAPPTPKPPSAFLTKLKSLKSIAGKNFNKDTDPSLSILKTNSKSSGNPDAINKLFQSGDDTTPAKSSSRGRPSISQNGTSTSGLYSGLAGKKGYVSGDSAAEVGKLGGTSFLNLGDPRETQVDTGLLMEEVGAVIRSHATEIRYCHQTAMLANHRAGGKLSLHFVILASGRVNAKSVSIVNSSTQDPRLDQCVISRLVSWIFPKPKGGVTVAVSYPFLFKVLDNE